MDLADMLKQWEMMEFPITVYKDTDIKVLGNIEDIQVRYTSKWKEIIYIYSLFLSQKLYINIC